VYSYKLNLDSKTAGQVHIFTPKWQIKSTQNEQSTKTQYFKEKGNTWQNWECLTLLGNPNRTNVNAANNGTQADLLTSSISKRPAGLGPYVHSPKILPVTR
jgi:hypothetical protein